MSLTISMFNWYSEYADNINQDVNNKGFSKQIKVDYIGQDKLYAFNEYSNAQIESFTLDGIQCNITTQNKNFSKGLVELNFDPSCAKNLDSDMNKIILITDKGTFSRLISTSDIDPSLSPTSNNEENNINYCPSGSFTYENVLFEYTNIQEDLSRQLTKTEEVFAGSKTSKIDITCNYPNVEYDTNTFTSSTICDPNYSLTSSNTCELITSCNSGDYSYNNELFSYPFLDSGSTYISTKTETNNNEGSILSKNLGLLCENTIVSNTSYEEVLSCLDGYELEEVKEFLESKITASDGASDDYFGYSVSIYENTIVVGAYGDDDKDSVSGSAYIFEKNQNGVFEQIQKITANDGASNDVFGWSVSIYEDTIVVGARLDDDKGSNSGSAYIFEIEAKETYCKLE